MLSSLISTNVVFSHLHSLRPSRYHSVTMPLIEEVKEEKPVIKTEEGQENQENQENKENASQPPAAPAPAPGNQGRTFVSFTDQATLESSFPSQGFRVPPSKVATQIGASLDD